VRELKPLAPPQLERLVKTCLAKDPDERWQNAHDVAADLRWIAEAGAEAAPRPSRSGGFPGLLPWLRAAAAALVAAWTLWVRSAPDAAVRHVQRLDVAFPPGVEPLPNAYSTFALSPDGQAVAVTGVRHGV
jgi:hypothetical protein